MCVTLWIEGTGEFFRRLEEDLPEISEFSVKVKNLESLSM
jgi:hypothetical protein